MKNTPAILIATTLVSTALTPLALAAGHGSQKVIGQTTALIAEAGLPTAQQTFVGVVQARPESSGAVQANGGDAGGQVFMFTFDVNKSSAKLASN